MNEILLESFKVIYRRRIVVVGFTVLVAAASVAYELLFPKGYSADKLLVVTQLESRKAPEEAGVETADLVPDPFSVVTYRELILSAPLLGEVLEELALQDVWEGADPPPLEVFRGNLSVTIDVVDETTRPVNYSPVIRLTAKAKNEAQALAIVEAWSDVTIRWASEAVAMHVAAAADTLLEQRKDYKGELETIWEEIRKEKSLWNLESIRSEIKTQLSLLADLRMARSTTERNLRREQQRLEITRGELMNAVREEEQQYRSDLDSDLSEMRAEASEWNIEVIQQRLSSAVQLLNRIRDDQNRVTREIARSEQTLATIEEQLVGEEPFLEMAKAPSEAAYWLAKSADSKPALEQITAGVMVSQELNQLYWNLRNDQKRVSGDLAGYRAELESLTTQQAEMETRIAETERLLAEHEAVQELLRANIEIGTKRYNTTATTYLLGIREKERDSLLEVAVLESELETIDAELSQAREELESLEVILAEHEVIQDQLQTEADIAREIFLDIAQSESYVRAARTLASGRANQGDRKAVGLNELSPKSYAIEDKGMLGRKGRVILSTLLAGVFICALVWTADFGLPMLNRFIDSIGLTAKNRA